MWHVIRVSKRGAQEETVLGGDDYANIEANRTPVSVSKDRFHGIGGDGSGSKRDYTHSEFMVDSCMADAVQKKEYGGVSPVWSAFGLTSIQASWDTSIGM